MTPILPKWHLSEYFRLALIGMLFAVHVSIAQSSQDGGTGVDGSGHEVLESIHIPPIPNAPFSLTLATEWTRPLMTGGTFTVTNTRSIKRDHSGKIYEERWLMMPKGSNAPPQMSYLQIYDPGAETFLECSVRAHVCQLHDWKHQPASPDGKGTTSASVLGGRGYRTREDRGLDTFAGIVVHSYRDSTVLEAGALGNDKPITLVRDTRFAPSLGFNLSSILETPTVGRQQFTVTEILLSEPEPKYFDPPNGFPIVDKRERSNR